MRGGSGASARQLSLLHVPRGELVAGCGVNYFVCGKTFSLFQCRLRLELLASVLTSSETPLVSMVLCHKHQPSLLSFFYPSGESRSEFPLTCYLAAGTQAEAGRQNYVIVMKMSDLRASQEEEEEEEGEQ